MKFEKKFGVSEIIALVALAFSGVAIWQSHLTRNDTKILNKLNFRPTLALQAKLKKTNNTIPAHLNLINKGPIDAVQVQVQFYFHKYSEEQQKVVISGWDSGQQWTLDRLPSLKQVNIGVNELSLKGMLPALSDHEKYCRILEIRLNYRREVDLKKYSERAFYFVNPDGEWVSERDSTLNSDFYKEIKEAVFGSFTVNSDQIDFSDTLHGLSDEEINSGYKKIGHTT